VPADEERVVDEEQPKRSRVRWGLLSLLFLGIALACVLVSGSEGDYTPLTATGLVLGLLGAAYCSYRGLKNFSWLPR
jgi:hypothetical protein